jgi:FAD/FMN-containing dehydrogenase
VQLEILTIEGERLTIGSQALDSPGYDLLALLTGSEGLLGVVIEVTVKLLARAKRRRLSGGIRFRRGRRGAITAPSSPAASFGRAGTARQSGHTRRGKVCAYRLSRRCRGDPVV